jgi:hypothetical protein
MIAQFDTADVPPVAPRDLNRPMQIPIANGQGLALLKGLSESELRQLECILWNEFGNDSRTRLAVALRFRALVDVFAARRLKDLLLERGFKVVTAAIAEASTLRLNTRFGFNSQKLFLAVDAATDAARRPVSPTSRLQVAA